MSLKVTVAMPVYNSEKYLEETIQTILNQSFQEFEFLILDDCSTDGSRAVIKQFQDPRIRLIELTERISLPAIRNLAFELAEGEYIALMDSDDHATPDRLAKEVDFLDRHPEIVAVSSDYQFMGSHNAYKQMPQGPERIKLLLMFRNPMANPSAMIRKSFLVESGIRYREDIAVCEDYDFWVDVAKVGQLDNINECFLHYRTGHSNTTGNSLRDEGKRIVRKQVIDQIHIKAFRNNGFDLSDEAFQTINLFFGDANTEQPTEKDLMQLAAVFEYMRKMNVQLKYETKLLDEILSIALDQMKKKHFTRNSLTN